MLSGYRGGTGGSATMDKTGDNGGSQALGPNAFPKCKLCELTLYAPGVRCPRCDGDERRARAIRSSPTGQPAISRGLSPLSLEPDDRYQVLDCLGRGGMGTVYRVWDRAIDEVVALKVLSPELHVKDRGVDRFKQEVRLARRISHPRVARLHDLTVWRGSLALTGQFIPGRNLEELIERGKPEPLADVARYLGDLCPALHAAHVNGVIHGDFKTSNVRIDPEHHAYVLDFGLASLVGESLQGPRPQLYGTPHFMAPEQAGPDPHADARSDIYALGVVLFQLLTGYLPFRGRNTSEILRMHREASPPAPRNLNQALPKGLEAVVLRCLHKDPDKRYDSTLELLSQALEALPPELRHRTSGSVSLSLPSDARKVLVIDYERERGDALCAELALRGMRASHAFGSESALEQVLEEKPSLIVLDLELPGMSGMEVLLLLKSNRVTAPIPVVVTVGPEQAAAGHRAVLRGAAGWLPRPLEPFAIELLVARYGR